MSASTFLQRCNEAQRRMAEKGVDYLFVSVSTDMVYLTGYETWPSERLTLFILPQRGKGTMLLPAFEAGPLRTSAPFFDIETWSETQDPFSVLDSILRMSTGRSTTVLATDTMPSRFLLPIINRMPSAEWGLASSIVSPLRMVKTAREVELLRHAQSRAMECLSKLLDRPFAGKRELDIGRELWSICLDSDLKVSNFAIVGSGPNGAHPHYHLGDRILSEGDAVVVDFGGSYQGYRADLTRTFHVGEPSEEFRGAYALVKAAQEAAFQAVRPGQTCESIDEAGRDVITQGGYGPQFVHRMGHGIGLDEHEEPYIIQGNSLSVQTGMTFTLEPGIYLEGKFGIRIEDQVVVTASGAERLGNMTRELVTVG